MTRGGVIAFLIGLVLGVGASLWLRPAPEPVVDPALAAQLEASEQRTADLVAAAERAAVRGRADSIALAQARSRIRVVAAPPATPADTVTVPDTLIVYEVPAPVAALVNRLERRVGSLEVSLDSTTKALGSALETKALAIAAKEQAERAVATEKGKRWRYRAEGGGIVAVLALIALLL